MPITKKLLLAPVVAAIALVALQSFGPAAQQPECVGPTGVCRIVLPNDIIIETTGQGKSNPLPDPPTEPSPGPNPLPTLERPLQDENLVVTNL